jgi:hypothetical protein
MPLFIPFLVYFSAAQVLASHGFVAIALRDSLNPTASKPSTSHPNLIAVQGKRQFSSSELTCGFYNGDPNSVRTADSGFLCRTDTKNGLWGFCPQTVVAVSDCGLAGNCVDSHSCSDGCGIGLKTSTTITTFHWYVFL